MKPLISVIVPVYNVEKYLKQCVESISKQSYANLEIILVDDGSTDNSPALCDEFAKEDSRIKVIHKKNEGSSSSRNIGVKEASGKYITFVDSDDYIDKEMLSSLYQALLDLNADISMCAYKVDKRVHLIPHKKCEYGLYTGREMVEKILYQKISNGPCAILYPSSCFESVSFPVNIVHGEDLATIFQIFWKCEKAAYSKSELYFYRQTPNSVMHQTFSVKLFDLMEVANIITIFFEKIGDEDLLKAAYARKFSLYARLIRQIPEDISYEFIISKRNEMWNFIKKYRKDMLLDANARLKNRIGALLTFGGCKFYRSIASRIL